MEVFHSWITTIVAAVLITSFLEMLLPQSDLQKFVRVVLGIFIMITILNPLLKLADQNINFERVVLKASGQGMDDLENILAEGRLLKEVTGGMVDEQYSQGLKKQVRSLALLVNGVADATAQVELEEKGGEKSGRIAGIKVLLKTEGLFLPNEEQTVQPVEIRISSEKREEMGKAEKEKLSKKEERIQKAVQTTVANFYNLSAEQVEVSILD